MDGEFWFIVLVAVSIWFWRDHSKLTQEVQAIKNCSEEQYVRIENFKQEYSWTSYEEMGTAIDDLEPVYCSGN